MDGPYTDARVYLEGFCGSKADRSEGYPQVGCFAVQWLLKTLRPLGPGPHMLAPRRRLPSQVVFFYTLPSSLCWGEEKDQCSFLAPPVKASDAPWGASMWGPGPSGLSVLRSHGTAKHPLEGNPHFYLLRCRNTPPDTPVYPCMVHPLRIRAW